MHEHTNAENKSRHAAAGLQFRSAENRSKDLTLAQQLVAYGQHLHERQKLNFWRLATNLAKYNLQPKKSMLTVKSMTDILSN
jgi:hypothetical protein